uniref:UDP-glucose 4-epimerase-like n=1 Tax=Styela clava TaxID=7725 RepID=UPI0019394BE5|nr:UDP-glucose 4-epimerase-like [Styela clava]
MGSTGKTILVAGGAGYLGSHAVVELLNAGHRVVVVDDLSNCQENSEDINEFPPSLVRVKQISGKECLHYANVNVCDKASLSAVFDNFNIDTVCDFSGKKAVGESTKMPMLYYKTNLTGTMQLLRCMKEHNVKNFLFSSSCTVYGAPDPKTLPMKETGQVGMCHCPYAKSKLFCESLLEDMTIGAPDYWKIVIMRYFNPVGAHESGLLGEDPKGDPQNLLPKLAQVAIGKRPILNLYGNDYSTTDGTPIRDYVHVMDVAKAHCSAINKLDFIKGLSVYNIGTGKGKSTWDMIREFEKACGMEIPLQICDRRPGDVPAIFSDTSKAERDLDWKAERTHQQMCEDLWRFYTLNPNGYQDISALTEAGIAI